VRVNGSSEPPTLMTHDREMLRAPFTPTIQA
jgi:hypothetical protein